MVSERSLYPQIINHFSEKYDILEEVHTQNEDVFYRKRIDILLKKKRRNETIAIEVKLTDWTKALKQAILNSSYSDYSYVALPYDISEKIDKIIFVNSGIGLLGVYKGTLKYMVKAKKSIPIRRLINNGHVSKVQRPRSQNRK